MSLYGYMENQKKETVRIMVEIPKELKPEFKKQAAESEKSEKEFGGDIIVEKLTKQD